MLLYLARHGETTANREGIILGRNDASLTTSGISLCVKWGGILTGYNIRCILTSPLGRAVASAAIIAREIGIHPVPMDELTELSCGRWEGRSREAMLGGRNVIRSSWTDRPPGGESCEDAEARVGAAMGIIRRRLEHGPVLAVGHAVVNRVLLKLWYGLNPGFANELPHPHDVVYVLGGRAPVRRLRADGGSGTGWKSR